jgi:small subunit ribosomal protein S6
MNKYEILYILAAGLDEEAYNGAVEKYKTVVVSNGGEVVSVDKMGTRKLAYPINYKNEGYYVVMKFNAGPELPSEIERQLRISDDCIRYMTTRL